MQLSGRKKKSIKWADSRKERWSIGILLFLLEVFFVFFTRRNYGRMHVYYSLADGFVQSDQIYINAYLFYPVGLLGFAWMTGKISLQEIIRLSRGRILFSDLLQILCLAGYYALLRSLAIIVGSIGAVSLCNWNLRYSVFWYNTDQVLEYVPNLWVIILGFFVNTVLGYVLIGFIYYVIGYCYGRRVFAFLTVILLSVMWNGVCAAVSFLIPPDGIEYRQWIHGDLSLMIIKVSLLIFMTIMCRYSIWRKDFL